jgi:hypothetical protein
MGNVLSNVWASLSVDRCLAVAAIVVGLGALLRVEWLFERLYKREKYIKQIILEESVTILQSYTAFSRAMQAVEINPLDLPKDSAFAMFTVFYLQKRLYPSASPEAMAALQKRTRNEAEIAARGYAQMLIASGQGKLREGFEFNEPNKPVIG